VHELQLLLQEHVEEEELAGGRDELQRVLEALIQQQRVRVDGLIVHSLPRQQVVELDIVEGDSAKLDDGQLLLDHLVGRLYFPLRELGVRVSRVEGGGVLLLGRRIGRLHDRRQ